MAYTNKGADIPMPVLLEPKAIITEARERAEKTRAQAMETAQQLRGEAQNHEALARAFNEAADVWFELAGANPEPTDEGSSY